jgi:hypothetical protein
VNLNTLRNYFVTDATNWLARSVSFVFQERSNHWLFWADILRDELSYKSDRLEYVLALYIEIIRSGKRAVLSLSPHPEVVVLAAANANQRATPSKAKRNRWTRKWLKPDSAREYSSLCIAHCDPTSGMTPSTVNRKTASPKKNDLVTSRIRRA